LAFARAISWPHIRFAWKWTNSDSVIFNNFDKIFSFSTTYLENILVNEYINLEFLQYYILRKVLSYLCRYGKIFTLDSLKCIKLYLRCIQLTKRPVWKKYVCINFL
jgi:hypothetical protein